MMQTTGNGLASKRGIDGDKTVGYLFTAVAASTVLIIFFIILFVFTNSLDAIGNIGIVDFLTGTEWLPLNDRYGALPIIVGTVLVTLGAIAFALPVGLGAAIYISEVASPRMRGILKPVTELFAGIPSVVYGFFGLTVMLPFLMNLFPGSLLYGSSWLAGSVLLGIMALPTVISVSEDALRAVPKSYREASSALGATGWETTVRIVVPAAVSGIATAATLGIGRAMGETMAVMMVTGNAAVIPEPLWNVFSLLRTITATLALEMPEVVIGSTHYSALFLLGFVLMVLIYGVTIVAKYAVKRTKKKFEEGSSSESGVFGRIAVKAGFGDVTVAGKFFFAVCAFLVSAMAASLFADTVASLVFAFGTVMLLWAAKRTADRTERATAEKIAHGFLGSVVLCVCALLAVLLLSIIIKGFPALSADFLTEFPSEGGRKGGIYPAIVGTLELIAGAMLIALPLGMVSGIYLAEYSKGSRATGIVRSAIDLLNGTPSIVFGLFGTAVLVVYFGWGYSLIGGCITLAIMILPVIIRTTEESLLAVPAELRDASRAMGANKWQTTLKIVLPAAFGGIITGSILGIGRAAGETAPIMMTAVVVFQNKLGGSVFEPIMALPYHLYYLASEVPGSSAQQYGTALVLLIMVLSIFAVASLIRHRTSKKFRW